MNSMVARQASVRCPPGTCRIPGLCEPGPRSGEVRKLDSPPAKSVQDPALSHFLVASLFIQGVLAHHSIHKGEGLCRVSVCAHDRLLGLSRPFLVFRSAVILE